jgi:hypothetical protein
MRRKEAIVGREKKEKGGRSISICQQVRIYKVFPLKSFLKDLLRK